MVGDLQDIYFDSLKILEEKDIVLKRSFQIIPVTKKIITMVMGWLAWKKGLPRRLN